MSYQPEELPIEMEEWRGYIKNELQKIANELLHVTAPAFRLEQRNTAPTKPREGDVYNADGTNWNPGAGAGLYEYIGGSYNKL